MVIISRVSTKIVRFFRSIKFRFLLTYLLMLTVVLTLLNTYPLIVSRNLIFDAKENYMRNQALNIAGTLERLDSLTEESIFSELSMVDTESLARVVISDAYGNVIYAVAGDQAKQDTGAIRTATERALQGYDTFECQFTDGSFVSTASAPVLSGTETGGAVYIEENDGEQGAILIQLQKNLRTISLVIMLFSTGLSILFSETVTRRITSVLNAVQFVREGDYGYRIAEKGQDELTELSREFNSLTNRLQATEEARRRFVSDASHELKTPLTSIKLLSDSILQNASLMDKDTMLDFVNDIGGEAERLTRITEKLISLTRLDSKVTSQAEIVDLKKAAEGVVEVVRPIADNRQIAIHCSFQENCCVMAGEDDLYQIMINLCENAVKYNVTGGSVQLTICGRGSSVLFICEDTGVGIPEDDLPHIFERFYRVDMARSREVGGSGLGLSIVHSMVTEYGGSVTAERRKNGGMRFTVSLPRVLRKESTEEKQNNTEEQQA